MTSIPTWVLLGSVLLAGVQTSARTPPPPISHEVSPVLVTAPRPKWKTDAPLRVGMVDVQNAVVAEYFAACANGPTRIEYDRLAEHLDAQSERIARLSQVSGIPRSQLDVLLREMSVSAVLLKGTDDPQAGVRRTIGVLISYSSAFSHPGWHPRHRARAPASGSDAVVGDGAPAPSDEEVAARTARLSLCGHLARRDLVLWRR